MQISHQIQKLHTLHYNSGQWTVDSGQWTVIATVKVVRAFTVDSGQWTVDSYSNRQGG
jgi:hypothetical protein